MQRVFAPMLDAVVRNDFTYAGQRLAKGASFPHRENGIDHVALRGLFLADLIDFVAPTAKPEKPPRKAA